MSLQTQHQNTHALGKFYFCPYIREKEKGKGMKIQLRKGAVALQCYVVKFFTFSVGVAAAVYISQATNTI